MHATSSSEVFEAFKSKFDIHQKTILEVGGIIEEDLIKTLNLNWTSVDPLYTPLPNYALVSINKPLMIIKHIKNNIINNLFDNNRFDYIFSCNAFQHITDLKKAFENFYKWLKPEGILYSHFGPIWTAPDGAHIEGLKNNNIIYNFWNNKLIPYWSHLYLGYEEMIDFLVKHYPRDFAEKIAFTIYKSNWINRFKFSDYLDLINNNHWEIIEMSCFEGIDYVPVNHIPSIDNIYEQDLLNKISITINSKENFYARDILLIIKKVK
jgi:SAM-dependent methyltransferase